MTEIRKSKQGLVLEGFGHAQRRRLRRVLNIGICDFGHKTLRQSQISLTWPKGPGFSGQNKTF